MNHYYIVYSIQSTKGSGLGRNTLSTDKPIDCIQHIKSVEQELLKACQEENPGAGYSNLFLVDWREIVSR